MPNLSCLLRHENTKPSTDVITRYALKADSVTISLSKTPIQVPVPQATPYIVDFGIFRPAITISAIIDDIGGNQTNSTAGYEGMDSLIVPSHPAGGANETFYIPYKNKLEENLYLWISDDDNKLEMRIGDYTNPIYNIDSMGGTDSGTNWATGGATYQVALQQARFQMDAGREDRWICQMQFVTMARQDTHRHWNV